MVQPVIGRGPAFPSAFFEFCASTRLRIVAVGLLGALAGYIGVPAGGERRPAPAAADPGLGVVLDGRPFSLREGDVSEARVAAIVDAALATPITLVAGAVKRTMPREAFGVTADVHRLVALLESARDPSSALRRGHDARHRGTPLELRIPLEIDRARAVAALEQASFDVAVSPVDARWDVDAARPVPSALGRRIDVYATLAGLDVALLRGASTFDAVLVSLPFSRSDADVAAVNASDVLGYFETPYPRGERYVDRTHNLKIAAAKLDGWVVLAGETFDFNGVVGARSDDAQFHATASLGAGDAMEGYAAAVSQNAGTLHAAAVLAGLEIVERHAGFRASAEVPMGLDAAVAYGGVTLRIRNPFDVPIVLRETVGAGTVRAEILGPARDRSVSVTRTVTRVVRFVDRKTDDARLPRGERVLVQRGAPGVTVADTRTVRLVAGDGTRSIVDAPWTSIYAPTTQIWRIGTADPDATTTAFARKARDDGRSEALVDEVVTITQGPGVASDRAGNAGEAPRGGYTTRTRVAGRYGAAGWTVREGFANDVAPAGKHVEAAKAAAQESPARDAD